MRCVSGLGVSILALACVLATPLIAQETAPAGDPDAIAADEADDELSELDRLSRAQDDPFAGVIEENERKPVSVTLRALNKITARYTDLEIGMNEIAHFGSLEILPRTCDKRPPEEFPETTAFLEIYDTEFNNRQSDLKIQKPEIIEDEIEAKELEVLPGDAIGETPQFTPMEEPQPAPEVLEGPQAEGVNIFRGWMFASTPALNALEHPVYDVWVIDCKTEAPSN